MKRSAFVPRVLCAVAFAALALVVVGGQQAAPRGAAVFTAAQAQAGRAVYAQNCSACHGANFEGSGDAPSLAGGTFRLKWGPKMVSELFGLILQTMPPTNPGSLGRTAALNATAYILQRNGAQPGQTALNSGVTTIISTVATGQGGGARAMRLHAPAVRGRCGFAMLGAGNTAGQGNSDAGRQRGVTVQGEVKNFVPVTPEMLKNPPAEDWLIFGRNYLRHSYSPLNQITRDNVKNLQLKWVWAMNDSGANQTTPIVHNGVMYLASPSNIVQALDAKTGDLIWETRVGPDQAPGYGGIRSIAIAEDKIFLPTSDAHMVALNARNGQILWDTPASDKPHVSTSGADRDQRQGADGAHRLRAVRRRRLLHQRVRHSHRRARVAVLHDSARRHSPAAIRGASCR